MKVLQWIFALLFSVSGYAQSKIYKFYNEQGRQISRKDFYESRGKGDNFTLYFEADTTNYGVLFYREKNGQLDDSTFQELKNYLIDLKGEQIKGSDIIVINYLTNVPENEQRKKTRTTWNIFDRNYVRKLNRIGEVSHFWISSLEKENLKHFYSNRINWLTDNKEVIATVFFPYEFTYGYYVVIKPSGEYYYYIGEYGKQNVWAKTEEFAE